MAHTPDLFAALLPPERPLREGLFWLGGFALPHEAALVAAVDDVLAQSRARHFVTPGGRAMSVQSTNCGALGWVSDERGYRYQATDPDTGRPWPPLPPAFLALAVSAAARAGYAFEPDVALVNVYAPGARMTLHQDKNEARFDAPIVSVSLGLPATFLFGGANRSERPERLPLTHGDVVVWGGAARLNFHGVLPVEDGVHPLLGRRRVNLTFRRAGR